MKWKITLTNSGCPDETVETFDMVLPLSFITVKFSGFDEYREDSAIRPISGNYSLRSDLFFKCDMDPNVPDKVTLEKITVGFSNRDDVVFVVNKEFSKKELSSLQIEFSPTE